MRRVVTLGNIFPPNRCCPPVIVVKILSRLYSVGGTSLCFESLSKASRYEGPGGSCIGTEEFFALGIRRVRGG